MAAVTSALLNKVTRGFGWFYLVTVFGFLVFALYLGLGPYGRMKLGKPGGDPHYS